MHFTKSQQNLASATSPRGSPFFALVGTSRLRLFFQRLEVRWLDAQSDSQGMKRRQGGIFQFHKCCKYVANLVCYEPPRRTLLGTRSNFTSNTSHHMGTTRTDFLTATPSVLTGAATVFAIAGGFYSYNTSPTPEAADALAMQQDWAMVAQDIRNTLADPETMQKLALKDG